jgi:aryl-alcohol dehydrogenase-like predicted oxidoreductase
MAQGVLSGKYLPGQAAPAGSRAADVSDSATGISKFLGDTVLERVQKLKPLAADLGLTLPQFAIAWVLQNRNVAGAIVGASRPEQVAENVKASGVVIPADVMAKVTEILGDSAQTDPTLTARGAPHRRPS